MSSSMPLRIPDATRHRLIQRARRLRAAQSQLALRYIEEGLRSDAHPLIQFRDGPAGRRPAVIGGPDVWEIARVLRDCDATGEEAVVETTASLLGESVSAVRAAAHYYADFKAEIDEWIAQADDEAEEHESAGERRRAAFG